MQDGTFFPLYKSLSEKIYLHSILILRITKITLYLYVDILSLPDSGSADRISYITKYIFLVLSCKKIPWHFFAWISLTDSRSDVALLKRPHILDNVTGGGTML